MPIVYELLPEEQIIFSDYLSQIKKIFAIHGYTPIETPAMEKIEVLLDKGDNNEIYALTRAANIKTSNIGDINKIKFGLRFDLTVPLGRYVHTHKSALNFPFKRSHIDRVWRADRTQHGRYKEFYQCDIDIINNECLSSYYDAEILLTMSNVLETIVGNNFYIKINNKKILIGIIKYLGIEENNIQAASILFDKLDKIDLDQIKSELLMIGAIQAKLEIIDLLNNQNFKNLDSLRSLKINASFDDGINELETVIDSFNYLTNNKFNLIIEPNLSRGLNYYTGTIYEFKLTNHPDLGTVASGGRYANLLSGYSNQNYYGVGASLGLTRLISGKNFLCKSKDNPRTIANILITSQEQYEEAIQFYLKIANILRNNNINTDIYLQNKKLDVQMKYANDMRYKYAILANKDEINQNKINIKNLATRAQEKIDVNQLIQYLENI